MLDAAVALLVSLVGVGDAGKQPLGSERRGLGEVDLSFVTDGLRAEREQGITIDVAYRYAATPHRKFVIADCPGHVQYTRNMATGASTADLALVLVDATSGLRDSCGDATSASPRWYSGSISSSSVPTRWIWSDRDRSAYQSIVDEMEALARRLGISSCTVIPIQPCRATTSSLAPRPPRGSTDPRCSTPWSRRRRAGGPLSTVSTGAAGLGFRCSGCSANRAVGATTPAW